MVDRSAPMVDLLGEAIGVQDLESVRLLSGCMHNISVPDRKGYTPLQMAIRSGIFAITALLMEKGAYDSAYTKDGETALHAIAAGRSVKGTYEKSWMKLTHVLIEQGGDLCALDNNRQTMCHKAAASNNVPILTLALENGIDADQLDANSNTPVHLAICHSQIEALSLLLQHIQVLDKGRIFQLLRGGKTYENLDTSLFATAVGNFNALKLLLKLGKKALQSPEGNQIYHLGDSYTQACHVAAAEGYADQVSLLLEAGARDYVNSSGQTLLHVAVHHKRKNVLPIFFEHNFKINIADSVGDTALHKAIALKMGIVTRQLLDHGAIVDIKAVELAIETEQMDLVRLLSTRLPQDMKSSDQRRLRSTDLLQALRSEDCTEITTILTEDRDILSSSDSSGQTPLHVAAATGNADVVEAVLNCKPDDKVINMKTRAGECALTIIMRAGFEKNHQLIEELLLNAGADTQEAMIWTKKNSASMWQGLIKAIRKS